MVESYADLLEAPELKALTERTCSGIASSAIEPQDELEDVFDLTVPGPANWLADGIVSHNSGDRAGCRR
ncbi:MAG: hypothetical protein R3E65_10975 [Steroidobacteraceae bacterium]